MRLCLLATLLAASTAVATPSDTSQPPDSKPANKADVVAGNGRETPLQLIAPALDTAVAQPFGLVIGPDQALYICEVGSHTIRRVDLMSGQSQVVVGTGKKATRAMVVPPPLQNSTNPTKSASMPKVIFCLSKCRITSFDASMP
ncbi:MAG UNVERIFIED_CONTAM: hypothetical protein LVR18_20805 [Planctomycetaceae bacterium]